MHNDYQEVARQAAILTEGSSERCGDRKQEGSVALVCLLKPAGVMPFVFFSARFFIVLGAAMVATYVRSVARVRQVDCNDYGCHPRSLE